MAKSKQVSAEAVRTGTAAVRHLRRLFSGRLVAFLEPESFRAFVWRWRDRQLHGGVPEAQRAGHVLRAPDMHGLAPGLFAPAYYRLAPADLPAPRPREVERFLRHLIARTDKPGFRGDVDTAITVALRPLAKRGVGLAAHVDALCDVADRYPALYQAAMLGDVAAARTHVDATNDVAERHDLVRLLAIQRIIWGLADVQRIAARGGRAAHHHVAWFLRPLMRTHMANTLLATLLAMAQTIGRLFDRADLAREAQGDGFRLTTRGPDSWLLASIRPAASVVENTLRPNERQAVLDTREPIRTMTRSMEAQLHTHRKTGSRENQQTIHQFVTAGLSEIAALFVTAYRFAEDEAHMLRVIKDPTMAASLWSVERPPYPHPIDAKLAARTRRLVAAYRPAILRDLDATPYRADAIRLGEISEQDAVAFLQRSAAADGQALELQELFDLSHRCRDGRS